MLGLAHGDDLEARDPAEFGAQIAHRRAQGDGVAAIGQREKTIPGGAHASIVRPAMRTSVR